MFGSFFQKGKRLAGKNQKKAAENDRFKEFAAQFLPKERTILAVTGANGFAGGQDGEEGLWTASIGLTAWMEEGSPDVHQGAFCLITIGDDHLLDILRQQAPRDFIIKFQARVSEDGQRLLLLGLPEPAFDLDLAIILEKQKMPVTFSEEGLGTFTLNRHLDMFETEVEWLGRPVYLAFDMDEDRAEALQTAKALLASAGEWDSRVREHAAGELLERANQWAEDTDGQDEPVTRERFMERMELESIQVTGSGSFEFWFNDGDRFYGHSIYVSGDLENGPNKAEMEGLGDA